MKLFNKNLEDNCPDEEIFIKAFLNEISLEEKEKLINHVLICEKCKLKFEVMKQLSNELKKRQENFEKEEFSASEERQFKKMAKQRIKELKGEEKRVFFRFVPVKYVTIMVGLLVILGGYFLIHEFHQKEIFRGEKEEKLMLIEPVGKISRLPSVFKWIALKEAEGGYYRFQLIDDELNTVWEITVENNKIIVPEDIRNKLMKGKVYIWRVEAFDDNDRKIDSGLKYFEIE